ncbi:MAG: hypothetical protein INQ03_19105 [Candidatus Heimdallarchaeota archaeon]|nr:hypothetical protein [Candidatus Heimdallarchaeota archaeon]
MEKVTLILIFSGFQGLIQSIIRFIMPLALIFYGWDLNDYALVYFFQALSMALPYIFGGFFTDLRGRKQTISLAMILLIIGIFTLAWSIDGDRLIIIILGQMIITLSGGMVQIGISTILVDETSIGQDRTHNFGKNFSIRNLLGFIGPVGIGLLISGINLGEIYWRINFTLFNQSIYVSVLYLVMFFSTAGVLLSLLLPKTSVSFIQENKAAKLSDFSESQKSMQKAFLVEEIMLGFLSGAIVPFINYYVLITYQPTDLVWSLIFGISNSSIALGNYFVGKYSESFGKGRSIVILNIFAPFFALGIALGPSFTVVTIFYILRAAFANAVHPAWESWYFSHTLDTARGRSFSIIQMGRRVARSMGSATGPLFYSYFGAMAFPIISIFYPISMSIPYLKEKILKEEI